MSVLVPTSDEASWLEARRKGVTASEIAVLMGLSPYSSPYKLFHQKLGILAADDDNDTMERGRDLEPVIARKFAAAHPEIFIEGNGRELYAHSSRAWQLATPDRCVWESDRHYAYHREPVAVAEYKSDGGSDEWGEPGTDEIPVHYRCQVLWQMDVMGVDRGYVACLRIRDWKLLTYELRMDDDAREDLKLMRGEALGFLDRVAHQDPPDVDWRAATTSALKTLYPGVGEDREVLIGRQLAISYRAALRRYDKAKQRKDEMTNRVLEEMGTAEYALDARTGEKIATRSVSHPKRVSVTLVREKYPDIAAECTPESKPQVKLTLAKPEKDTTS